MVWSLIRSGIGQSANRVRSGSSRLIKSLGTRRGAFAAQVWHCPEKGINLSQIEQITNGWAQCTGLWVCNDLGEPTETFEQGETAHILIEFRLSHDIEVPICGAVIRNEQGIAVYGKSNLETDTEVPQSLKAGSIIRFHQEIVLNISVGRYEIDIGLTTVPAGAFQQRATMPHIELIASEVKLCDLKSACRFAVVFQRNPRVAQLLHHGIANLPDRLKFSMVRANGSRSLLREMPSESSEPTIFHVTHWKAGSQWIFKILSACAGDRIVTPSLGDAHVRLGVQPGKIYPTVYMTRDDFLKIRRPANSRHFVVIRDLRDTLVSAYFSFKISHRIGSHDLKDLRDSLSGLGKEDGMRFLMDQWLTLAAEIQISWLESGEKLIRYEDLLSNDAKMLEKTLIDDCGIQMDRAKFRQLVEANRFEKLTGGRQRGVEDSAAHERKGIAGDWRNHFSDEIKRMFKMRFGGVLVEAGYEKDLSW